MSATSPSSSSDEQMMVTSLRLTVSGRSDMNREEAKGVPPRSGSSPGVRLSASTPCSGSPPRDACARVQNVRLVRTRFARRFARVRAAAPVRRIARCLRFASRCGAPSSSGPGPCSRPFPRTSSRPVGSSLDERRIGHRAAGLSALGPVDGRAPSRVRGRRLLDVRRGRRRALVDGASVRGRSPSRHRVRLRDSRRYRPFLRRDRRVLLSARRKRGARRRIRRPLARVMPRRLTTPAPSMRPPRAARMRLRPRAQA